MYIPDNPGICFNKNCPYMYNHNSKSRFCVNYVCPNRDKDVVSRTLDNTELYKAGGSISNSTEPYSYYNLDESE